MYTHTLKAEKPGENLEKENQLAWKIAGLAVQAHEAQDAKQEIYGDGVVDMIKNRLIDNAAIAMAAIKEKPVAVARAKALATQGSGGATVFGMPRGQKFGPREAAFANAVAVRFRDQDDTYLANEYTHPDDNISPLLAVAQQMGASGKDLTRGIAVAYEVHIALAGTGGGTGINLHKHNVDHMTHIAAATAAGIASMLKLDQDTTYHAINFAVHNAVSSRQSRRGDIGAQKEFVPGFSAEIAIDAVNAAMQGMKGPNPVYEGTDSILASFLKGRDHGVASKFIAGFVKSLGQVPGVGPLADKLNNFLGNEPEYKVALAEPGKDRLTNIMLSYPKEHAFEYQGQAIIDLALKMRGQLPKRSDGTPDLSKIGDIVLETSEHTNRVIGSGSNKNPDFDSAAYGKRTDAHSPRGTLDHSIMFAIARTLQLGEWSEKTYDFKPDSEEGRQLGELMKKIKTKETREWERRYHSTEPADQAFGGKMTINLTEGAPLVDEQAVANAHPLCPTTGGWKHPDYEKKFNKLTQDIVADHERNRFFDAVDRLEDLSPRALGDLTPEVSLARSRDLLTTPEKPGIYGAYKEQRLALVGS